MKNNVGGIDKILRIVAGLGLIAWAAVGNGPAWAWIGVMPLATGLLGTCPAYSLLGFNSCPLKKDWAKSGAAALAPSPAPPPGGSRVFYGFSRQ